MSTILSRQETEAAASHHGEPTWEVAQLYPRQGSWTEADYLELDSAGDRLIEFSDGVVEFLPMPTWLHQRIVRFLIRRLDRHVESRRLGEVLSAPLPVRLRPGKYREPDVLFLRAERHDEGAAYPSGAELVMEVVSESAKDRVRDLEEKRAEYAAAGIPEYWIVDPETRTILVLTLDGVEAGGPYRVHGEFRPGEAATSLLIPGFAVSVDECFAAGEGKNVTPSPDAPA